MATVANCGTREEWLGVRRRYIGASDVPAILGVTQWRSPYQVAMEKLGHVPDDDNPVNDHMFWGTKLEPVVRQVYQEKTGRQVQYHGAYAFHTHPHLEWLGCTPDGLIIDEKNGEGDYEGKCANQFMAKEWGRVDDEDDEDVSGGGVPLMYNVQLQTQMAVTGHQWGSIAVLIGGHDFRWYDIARDDDFIDVLLGTLEQFWVDIHAGRIPEPDDSEATSRFLARLYKEAPGQTCVQLPEVAAKKDARLEAVKTEIKLLKKEETQIKNWFKSQIGSATYGIGDGFAYSLKTTERDGYVVRPAKFRSLRREKARG